MPSTSMSLPFRCSMRALRDSRRIPSSLIASQKLVSGPSHCQCRGRWSINNRSRPDPSFQSRLPDPRIPQEYNPDDYIDIRPWDPMHIAFLRDSCTCSKCVDPSSKQKNFQTTDIPRDIKVQSMNISPTNGTVDITWENDILGFESGHKSIYPREFFHINESPYTVHKSRFQNGNPTVWNKKTISRELEYVDYSEYMNTDVGLYRAVLHLHKYGLLLIRGVPESEKSVEEIALRIGNLRDSLYGRTWDVKSVPEAKNVAYTSSYLGLHMDLLYMANPPGFQFLHCMHNTCEGGSSLFSDAFWAVAQLSAQNYFRLTKMKVAYHYKNAGEHYYYRHPVINVPAGALNPREKRRDEIEFVNYSPPFQANHVQVGTGQQTSFPALLEALREFSSLVEDENNLFEYRLQEGECVIFNNRRVLHGRRQFDTATGMRWLRGAYIDTDVFMSKYRVLSEKFERDEKVAEAGKKLVNSED